MLASEISERTENVFRKIFTQKNLVFHRQLTTFDVENWDSLRNMKLLFAVEAEFKIKFKPADVIRLANIGELIDLVGQLVPKIESDTVAVVNR